MTPIVCTVVGALVLATAVVPMAAAQTADATRGQIAIAVVDSTRATVSDAIVVVARGTERRTAMTRADGMARFGNLGAGEWTITVTRDGFTRWQQTVAVANGTLEVAAALEVAGFAETVQVRPSWAPRRRFR